MQRLLAAGERGRYADSHVDKASEAVQRNNDFC
jgi:hypothetical protein